MYKITHMQIHTQTTTHTSTHAYNNTHKHTCIQHTNNNTHKHIQTHMHTTHKQQYTQAHTNTHAYNNTQTTTQRHKSSYFGNHPLQSSLQGMWSIVPFVCCRGSALWARCLVPRCLVCKTHGLERHMSQNGKETTYLIAPAADLAFIAMVTVCTCHQEGVIT